MSELEPMTAMQHAIMRSDTLRIDELMESDYVDLGARSQSGNTLLHLAVKVGKQSVVHRLLGERKILKLINARNRHGRTPLLSAIHRLGILGADLNPFHRAERVKIIQMLLDNGAVENIEDAKGNNAMHYAARYGLVDVCEILHRANDHLGREKNQYGLTPLEVTKRTRDLPEETREKIQTIMTSSPRFVLSDAESSEHSAVFGRLANLHRAVRLGNENFFETNLKMRPEAIQETDEDGYTVLHVAMRHNKDQIIPRLVEVAMEKNIDLNILNDESEPPLVTGIHYAAFRAILAWLEHTTGNAPPPPPNAAGETPLHILIHYLRDFEEAFENAELTESGVLKTLTSILAGLVRLGRTQDLNFINHQDNAGNTALHLALLSGEELVAEELVKLGADLDIENELGKTPRDLDYELDLDLFDNDGDY